MQDGEEYAVPIQPRRRPGTDSVPITGDQQVGGGRYGRLWATRGLEKLGIGLEAYRCRRSRSQGYNLLSDWAVSWM